MRIKILNNLLEWLKREFFTEDHSNVIEKRNIYYLSRKSIIFVSEDGFNRYMRCAVVPRKVKMQFRGWRFSGSSLWHLVITFPGQEGMGKIKQDVKWKTRDDIKLRNKCPIRNESLRADRSQRPSALSEERDSRILFNTRYITTPYKILPPSIPVQPLLPPCPSSPTDPDQSQRFSHVKCV